MATRRMFKVWHAEDKKLVVATSLDELIDKGLTKLQKARENFKCLRLSDGTDVDDDELLAFLEVSKPIHFVFSDEEVPSTSTCRPTGTSDHQKTTEGEYGVHSLPSTPTTSTSSTPTTSTSSNVSFLTPPPSPLPPPDVTASDVALLVVQVQQCDMAQSTTKTQATTQIYKDFMSGPMGDKAVQQLAGIGHTIGERLRGKGFDKAYVVFGKFLMLKKDKEKFMQWLKEEAGANTKYGSECYECLKDWCDKYFS